MDVRHDDADLARIEQDPSYRGKFDVPRVRAFRKVMNIVRSVQNEAELRQWKSLRLEKLKGKRQHQHSLRLNDQWRLIIELESREGQDVCVVVKGVEDYH